MVSGWCICLNIADDYVIMHFKMTNACDYINIHYLDEFPMENVSYYLSGV